MAARCMLHGRMRVLAFLAAEHAHKRRQKVRKRVRLELLGMLRDTLGDVSHQRIIARLEHHLRATHLR